MAHRRDGFLAGLTGDKSFGDREQQLIEHEQIKGSATPMNEIQDDLSLPRQFTEGNYKLKAVYF